MQLKDQGKCNQDSLKKKIKCHGKGENLSQKTCERIRNWDTSRGMKLNTREYLETEQIISGKEEE